MQTKNRPHVFLQTQTRVSYVRHRDVLRRNVVFFDSSPLQRFFLGGGMLGPRDSLTKRGVDILLTLQPTGKRKGCSAQKVLLCTSRAVQMSGERCGLNLPPDADVGNSTQNKHRLENSDPHIEATARGAKRRTFLRNSHARAPPKALFSQRGLFAVTYR